MGLGLITPSLSSFAGASSSHCYRHSSPPRYRCIFHLLHSSTLRLVQQNSLVARLQHLSTLAVAYAPCLRLPHISSAHSITLFLPLFFSLYVHTYIQTHGRSSLQYSIQIHPTLFLLLYLSPVFAGGHGPLTKKLKLETRTRMKNQINTLYHLLYLFYSPFLLLCTYLPSLSFTTTCIRTYLAVVTDLGSRRACARSSPINNSINNL